MRDCSGRADAVQIRAVVGPVGAEPGGQPEVAARRRPVAGLVERAPEAEVRVVVDGRALDDRGELVAGTLVAAASKVRATQRLADRRLVGLVLAGLLQRDRGGGVVAVLEQLAAAAVQVVHVLRALLGCPRVVAHQLSISAVARTRSTTSRIAPATCAFGPNAADSSPSAVTMVTSLASASKPMSRREMSLTTTASMPLRSSFPRARATAPSPCSAAKPTSTCPARRSAATPASTSVVGSSSRARPSRPVFEILLFSGAAGRKSATAAAMIRTSEPAKACLVARSISPAVSTSM